MICPECEKTGQKSKVYGGFGLTTAMFSPGYYDEDGNYHHHDPNTTTSKYNCSNGHDFTVVSHKLCWCEVGGKPGDPDTVIKKVKAKTCNSPEPQSISETQ